MRREIRAGMDNAEGEDVIFEVGPVTVELHVEVRRNSKAKAGMRAYFVVLQGEHEHGRSNSHTVAVVLNPLRWEAEAEDGEGGGGDRVPW